jgi:hypothetical protein
MTTTRAHLASLHRDFAKVQSFAEWAAIASYFDCEFSCLLSSTLQVCYCEECCSQDQQMPLFQDYPRLHAEVLSQFPTTLIFRMPAEIPPSAPADIPLLQVLLCLFPCKCQCLQDALAIHYGRFDAEEDGS